MRRDGTLLKRYRAGEFDQVWREIRTYPSIEGEFREEVMEIADATMQRVVQNADLVASRLQAIGWQVLSSQDQSLRTPPKSSDEAVFSRIVEMSGAPIPPTLLAFWRVVGGINWVWDYRSEDRPPDLGFDLPSEEHDALCIEAPSIVTDLFDEWIYQKADTERDHEHQLSIVLAPDYLHKANISGGSPYCVLVPFLGADPLFSDERHGLPFLDYLRLAFRWAGFPGLDRHSARSDVRDFIARFGKDLLPF